MPLHRKTVRVLEGHDPVEVGRFHRVTHKPFDWCIREGWEDAILAPTNPDWLTEQPSASNGCIKHRQDRTTWQTNAGGRRVFVKVIRSAGLAARVKRILIGSPAEREFRVAVEAERLGVPIAKPIAVGAGGSGGASIFISEWVDGAITLDAHWNGEALPGTAGGERFDDREVYDAVARLFSKAHAQAFIHRDGHPQNILIHRGADVVAEALFVDVHGASLKRCPAPRGKTILSLAQLMHASSWNTTRAQRLRFLRTYLSLRPSLRVAPTDHADLKAVAGEIAVARSGHAERLARRRDRRLRRGDRYFATIDLGSGWSGTFVLRLAARKSITNPMIPVRSEREWADLVTPDVLRSGAGRRSMALEEAAIGARPQTAPGFASRVLWTLAGSPHRRQFETCHQLRHRDQRSDLLLGVAEHRAMGLIDRTVLFIHTSDAGSKGECFKRLAKTRNAT